MKKSKFTKYAYIISISAFAAIIIGNMLYYMNMPVYKIKEENGEISELITPQGIKYVSKPELYWEVRGFSQFNKGWGKRIGITDYSKDLGVFRMDGDKNTVYLNVKNKEIFSEPNEYMYRTDIDYDYILENEIDRIEFMTFSIFNSDIIRIVNEERIDKIMSLILNKDKIVTISNSESEPVVFAGMAMLCSEKLPGLCTRISIFNYKDDYYYQVIDSPTSGTQNKDILYCVKDENTVDLPSWI